MKHALLAIAAACGGSSKVVTNPELPDPPACTAKPADSVVMEVLLHPALADAGGVGLLAETFDISPSRLLVIADKDRMYMLGWGGLVPVEGISSGTFAYTSDGLLMTIRGAELTFLGESGQLETLFTLPNDGMGLAAGGPGVMYLFDRKSKNARYGFYQLTRGMKARKLFESPAPIDSVAQVGARLFVASGGAVFEVTPGTRMRVIANISGKSPIRSIAADESGRVYFSDSTAVYSVTDGCVAVVTRELGGALRVRDDALLVLDTKKRTLVRLTPVSAFATAMPEEPTTVADSQRPTPAPPGLGAQRKAAIGVGVGGLALIAVGLGFAVSANGTYDDAHGGGHCDAKTVCDEIGFAQVEDAYAAARLSTLTTLSGAGLVGLAGVLWLTGKRSPESPRTAIIPVVHRDDVGVAVSGRF